MRRIWVDTLVRTSCLAVCTTICTVGVAVDAVGGLRRPTHPLTLDADHVGAVNGCCGRLGVTAWAHFVG